MKTELSLGHMLANGTNNLPMANKGHFLYVCVYEKVLYQQSSHIIEVVNNAFYHLYLARRLCLILASDDMASINHDFVTSWLNYSSTK